MATGSTNGTLSASTSGSNAGTFETFLESWLVRQEHYLDELLSAQRASDDPSDDYLRDLNARVLSHYQQYYEEKSKAAQCDVFSVFSPPWFTPLEHAFLWIAGFKPSLAFRLVAEVVFDLSEEQIRRITGLKEETRIEERPLDDELARIQESLAAPPLLAAARRAGRGEEGAAANFNFVMGPLRTAMTTLVGNADSLRTSTSARVVEILTPPQSVRFLAAATLLQVRIRFWGLKIEAERRS
ncbi:Transcription factor TGA like domain [Dillenia turbinata]|uniref:Transcription factor TGA like domain n=1 Tax=Dillenia turbinata TaxID=194707 RepID=A0AAN8VZD1_9MAGN